MSSTRLLMLGAVQPVHGSFVHREPLTVDGDELQALVQHIRRTHTRRRLRP